MLKNKKITLINPPYERIAKGYDFVRHITNRSPSLGLLYIASAVRNHGYEVTLIESDIENLNVNQVVNRLCEQSPDFIGISLFTVSVWQSALIAKQIKQQLPQCTIIVGGPHISSMSMETLERFKEFDLAVIHEGEEVLPKLLDALVNKQNLGDVLGIIYRENGELIKTQAAPTISDLDKLPTPAWGLLPNFPEAYLPAIYDYPQAPVATLVASRGCPFLCKFCDTSTFGAQVRAYSPEKVYEMMKNLQDDYGIRHIQFVDDLFLASRIRTLTLCDLIIKNKLNMTWSCAARVDTVKPDVLARMKAAGCWEISFGLETGSNELLQKMEKSARVEISERAINWTAAAGIRCKGLFMLGYPGETKETIAQTKAFTKRIPMTTMNLTKFTPYPGSPIYREIYGTNICEDHWEKMNGMNFVWVADGFTKESLDREYQAILISFYKQHRIAHKYMMMTFQHPMHFKRLIRFFLGYCKAKINR